MYVNARGIICITDHEPHRAAVVFNELTIRSPEPKLLCRCITVVIVIACPAALYRLLGMLNYYLLLYCVIDGIIDQRIAFFILIV